MRRVATACLVGSAIEFYDFLIYGTAAALVFPAVFFPHLNPAVATIASMGTFGAAFLSRPVGAAVFGYFGDHLGRRKALVATLLIMAVSTVTVGLVPTTAAIGVAAPLMLVALRLLQGFAVGGYWAGVGAAERRIRAGRQTGPVRDVHPPRWRHRPGGEQPDLSRRELHHRRSAAPRSCSGGGACRS